MVKFGGEGEFLKLRFFFSFVRAKSNTENDRECTRTPCKSSHQLSQVGF